jgi:hypothetical protein
MDRKVDKRQTWPMAIIGTPDDIQFDPRAYMDIDTASSAIYNTDNTATTSNTTANAAANSNHSHATPAVTPHSDTAAASGSVRGSSSHMRANNNSAAATMPLPHTKPKRRLTFGGLRSDTNGAKYMSQRKPSNPIIAAVSSVGKAVSGAVRRASLKITANGRDVEIISENKTTSTPRGNKMIVNSSEDSLAYDDVETHYHNRQRRVFEPQKAELLASAWWIRVCGVLNVICAVFYLQWRYVIYYIIQYTVYYCVLYVHSKCVYYVTVCSSSELLSL